ncbi:hypothetical protein ABGB18_36545 [Nonomuraea sp. B12E4]|uniref:hypothetical protein n=1 Tax=Nonomuraea sp. B12E4 TaxID=3153564 RepID=UPI00325CFA48
MNERISRIESMLEQAGPAASELVKELLDLYGDGLARVMAAVGEEQAARLAADELVSSLLLLHDLHPLDTRARVESALAGTSAEVLVVEEDWVRLRLRPTGCGSAPAESALREAVRNAAPEIEHVEIQIEAKEPTLIPIESLTVRRGATAGPGQTVLPSPAARPGPRASAP